MSLYPPKQKCEECPYIHIFKNILTKRQIDTIAEHCISMTFRKGENICKQNLRASHTLFLTKGLVKIYIEGLKKNTIIDINKGGNFIALQTNFGDNSCNYSITALENSKVCMLEMSIFKEIYNQNPGFLKIVTEILAHSTNNFFRRIIFCNNKTVKEKLAFYLLWFAEEIYNSDTYVLGMSRLELSNFLGISRENTVRALSAFKKEGFIDIQGKTIIIKNKDALKALASLH